MKNKQVVWAKTILIAYDELEQLCGAIDKLVDTIAGGSFYSCGPWIASNEVYNVSKKIINLSEKKVKYINLKVIVEKCMKMLNKKDAKVVVLRYVKKMEPAEIAGVLKISLRSYFRIAKSALEQLADAMETFGYNFAKMENEYLSDLFISSIYRSVFLDGRLNNEVHENSKSSILTGGKLKGIVNESMATLLVGC